MEKKTILSVEKLSIGFDMYRKGINKEILKVITNLNVKVCEGELVAIVGSSGSGKSILADAILGILPTNARVTGNILYRDEPLTANRICEYRGKEIAFIPQSVLNFDPLMRIGKQVKGLYGSEIKRKELFRRYDLSETVAEAFPHQLSGGMSRRALNAGALINDAKLIIADEPTPGLSEEQAERLMGEFADIAHNNECGILLITHDINLAIKYADRIAVFYAGTTVETAHASDFQNVDHLRHPYTKALWHALPQNGFKPIPGVQPYAGTVKSGCVFADRCEYRTDDCMGEIEARTVRGGEVRCVHAT